MIRHIVMWNLKDFAEGNEKAANAAILKKSLEALVGVVDGLLSLEVGTNYTPGGFDLCLCSTLTSKEALNGYINHPEHLKVREFVHKVITERVTADYEIDETKGNG